MKTYRDFEWLFRDYPWTENGLHVTYVLDATPARRSCSWPRRGLHQAWPTSGNPLPRANGASRYRVRL
ncbi:hypothetical protein [Rhodococcus sp. FH8]|uniref:hypothetical protein n=1 Tax=Rhodococcus sp. FH8 TaxID=1761013 RepID=UPI001C4EF105|nr:hypothetical protein [Rhodococcus sp. FH8]